VQSEWSTFIQSAASVSKEMQSAPAVAPAASGIPQRTKPSWDRGVGHVPTMSDGIVAWAMYLRCQNAMS
jgi:hypothetical protein